MYNPNENIVKDVDYNHKRGIPAVPTPDWSIEKLNKKGYTTNAQCEKVDESHNVSEISQHKADLNNWAAPNSIKSTSESSGICLSQTPHKAPSSRTDVASCSSVSRICGDVTFTPTNSVHTPVLNAVNPHAALTAGTPVATSGVNQAKNSIKLQNCVSTTSLGCELNLLDIYCKTRYSEYNPQRFQGVVMKILDPKATALVFRSGKLVCTGTKNENDSYIASRKFARIIQKLGFPVKFLDFKIQNFCATADLRFPIRLEALQQAHGQFSSYEPELFPGLIYRMVRPRVVLLIFVNGKVIFTGGKNRNEITDALETIYPILRGYRIS